MKDFNGAIGMNYLIFINVFAIFLNISRLTFTGHKISSLKAVCRLVLTTYQFKLFYSSSEDVFQSSTFHFKFIDCSLLVINNYQNYIKYKIFLNCFYNFIKTFNQIIDIIRNMTYGSIILKKTDTNILYSGKSKQYRFEFKLAFYTKIIIILIYLKIESNMFR